MKKTIAVMTAACALAGQVPADNLEKGFSAPPDSAKPHTWWHWMNGNITKEGITADLEAMQRVGIGGAQIFSVGCGINPGPVNFLTPEWREMMKHAAKEADRVGVELCIHNCAGWSSSGGPWNTPSNAMQQITVSETKFSGPAHFSAVLPQPPTKLDFYRDIEVLAFPSTEGEDFSMAAAAPKLTADGKPADAALLCDGKTGTSIELPLPGPGKTPCLDFEFSSPLTVRSARMVLGTGSGIQGVIQVSEDGKTYRDAKPFAFPFNGGDGTLSVALDEAPTPAQFYRIKFTAKDGRTKRLAVAEVSLSPALRVSDVLAKSGMNMGYLTEKEPSRSTAAAPGLAVPAGKIINLTGQMTPDGQLDWDAPAGQWTILRIGYTPTGRENHPAPDGGLGLECDKLSAEALDAHWNGFVQKVIDDLGPLAGKGKAFNNVLIDSYEVGGQNWTPKFREEFLRLRGYDPLPWLITVTGRVVDSPEASDRFLRDLRRTIADLFAEKYFGRFKELCNRRGLTASIEPYTGPFESLQSGEPADIPMGEFWVHQADGHFSQKLAASVGHIYGKPVIGAESFTAAPSENHGRWLEDPYALKIVGDMAFCKGINRYIFHRYAMQPWTNRVPGMTMGQWGTHFDRTCTWWEQSRAWMQYIARSQFMLQQGLFIADAAAFCGETAPVQMPGITPVLPAGYDYDGINAGVLLNQAAVKDGMLVLKSGMRYRVLSLSQPDRTMTPELLRKLRGFVADGLTLVGPPPEKSPSLSGYPKCDEEVKTLAAEMWGDCDGKTVTEHRLGKGKTVWGQTMEQVFSALNVKPDFEFATASGSRLIYIHRLAGDADIYFVSNQRDQFDAADCTFRVSGKVPEFWHPDTGLIEQAPVWREEDGRITVPLQFDPAGSVFVVFRKKASGDHIVSAAFSAEATPAAAHSELTIQSARYETLDGKQGADVTALLAGQVRDGELKITANKKTLGIDPMYGLKKQLRVTYVLNGQTAEKTVPENAALEIGLPGSAAYSDLKIQSAKYESMDGTQGKDVTALLAGQIRDGLLKIKVDNKTLGGDPAINQKKQLRVKYTLNGQAAEKIGAENIVLEIGLTAAAGEPPAFELLSGANGKMKLCASSPGTMELKTASGKTVKIDVRDVLKPVELSGPWELNFQPDRGAPAQIILPKLISWTEHADSGVKYFSGTAAYVKEVEIPAEMLSAGHSLWLDLGQIKNIAEVSVNGTPLGILWKPPFRVNITASAKPGKNKLEIKITNLWPNRLIGDEQLPPDCEWGNNLSLKQWPQWLLAGKPSPTGRLTFTTWHHWKKDEALLPSGLLGPVMLHTAKEIIITP